VEKVDEKHYLQYDVWSLTQLLYIYILENLISLFTNIVINYFVKSVFNAPVPVYNLLITSAFSVQLSLNYYSISSGNFSKADPCSLIIY
jgi:hypothetical protein